MFCLKKFRKMSTNEKILYINNALHRYEIAKNNPISHGIFTSIIIGNYIKGYLQTLTRQQYKQFKIFLRLYDYSDFGFNVGAVN